MRLLSRYFLARSVWDRVQYENLFLLSIFCVSSLLSLNLLATYRIEHFASWRWPSHPLPFRSKAKRDYMLSCPNSFYSQCLLGSRQRATVYTRFPFSLVHTLHFVHPNHFCRVLEYLHQCFSNRKLERTHTSFTQGSTNGDSSRHKCLPSKSLLPR